MPKPEAIVWNGRLRSPNGGNNGTATCTSAGPLQDCGCIPDKNLCGTPALCDVPNCNGSLDIATGGYTCKKGWAPCECKPSPAMCGEPKPCEDNGCGGDFGPNEVHATCKAKFKGCECKPSPKICGKAPSCDNCAGGWQAGTNKPVCSTVRFGCPCIPGSLCGSLAGCDDNGCVGAFPPADPRVAKCTGAFEGCACRPGEDAVRPGEIMSRRRLRGWHRQRLRRLLAELPGCPCILDSANLPPPSGGLCSDVAECSNGNCRGPPPVGGGDKGKCASNSNRPGCSCHYTVPDLAPADSAYCVGIYVQDCQQQPCTPKYSLGYARSGGDVVYVDPDLRTDIRSLCGATMDGAQVVCDKDTARVNAQCTGDYGVAFFKSRSCRTICPQQDGSNPRCMQRQPPGAPYSEYITKLFVCDRYLPPWY